ncbi:MAG TPA: glycosyltransferase [Hanamia sp.]|nr:glycosyltransferase [Hanamia sp.]
MRIVFTVTNDLNYDQRMIRICESLSQSGFDIKIIGVLRKDSNPVLKKSYEQKRIPVFYDKGIGFYLEYNIRLFFYLLFQRFDVICCIDLDTMLPVYFTSLIRGKTKVYDAHEYFSQQKEIVSRPKVYKAWHFIERHFLPSFKNGYTVSDSIATEFSKLYGVDYSVIKNVPVLQSFHEIEKKEKFILYQGSVNEARGFELLIPAMKLVNAVLYIYGDGNFFEQTKRLIEENSLQQKVFLKGKITPVELQEVTQQAYIGINLVERCGLNQLYSLANKFFDYMHYAIPQVSMDFPEYKKINDVYEIALLIKELTIKNIADAINELLNNETEYQRLKQNCVSAREHFTWQKEEQKLIAFYKKIILQ